MATPPAESQVSLRLRPDEQWLLHAAVANRIEAARRAEASQRDPEFDDRRLLRKVEDGTHLFAPEELAHARSALSTYRQRPGTDDEEDTEIVALLERIDSALPDRRAASPR